MDLSACFRVGISSFCVRYVFWLYYPRRIHSTVLAGSPPCSTYLRLCMFVLSVGAPLSDAFLFFCAVICTASQTFAESFMRRRHTSCVRRFCTIFSLIRVVGRAALHGGGKGDQTVRFSPMRLLLIAEFYPLRCSDTGGYFTLFSRLKFALLSAAKNLKFLRVLYAIIKLS